MFSMLLSKPDIKHNITALPVESRPCLCGPAACVGRPPSQDPTP